MYENIDLLKCDVWKANLMLKELSLVVLTWGNVSAVNKERSLFAIKPSGISYDEMIQEDMVVLNMHGNKVGGELNPSSDTKTHLRIYQAFPEINAVVHTHSSWATIFAQMGCEIPCLGTTHADTFFGSIPCTRKLTDAEINADYETETGNVIIEHFRKNKINPVEVPGVLVKGHGPFAWGETAKQAVINAYSMEQIANMAWHTLQNTPQVKPISKALMKKHFFRKHGSSAYYGQENT